jgi:hypothetical protein
LTYLVELNCVYRVVGRLLVGMMLASKLEEVLLDSSGVCVWTHAEVAVVVRLVRLFRSIVHLEERHVLYK